MMEIKTLDINSHLYPEHLRQIPDAPKLLYYVGDISLIQNPGIAVVGTRRSSPYGRWAAYEIAKRIGRCGYTVVSGMAEGIDTQGHKGCLAAGGKTVAVLGTGVDICFPKSNEKLYTEIAEKGLLLSELAPGVKGMAWNFPQRNRIISGLSKSVVVVEGAIKSGSMITANLALNQGRDVFAVPGNINQPNSVGVNSLIRDGAMPILSIEEVEETLGLSADICDHIMEKCSKEEAKILECARFEPGIDIDALCQKCSLSYLEAASIICEMELKGYVRKDGGRIYSAIPGL